MRKSVVPRVVGAVSAALMLAPLLSIASLDSVLAKTTSQCISEGNRCHTRCVNDNFGGPKINACKDQCGAKESTCVVKASDQQDLDVKKKRKDTDKGGNKVPPKGGKGGQEVVSDPVRPPKTPGGATGPQSTGTWTPPSQTPPPPGSTVKDPRTTPPGWVKPSFGAGAYRP
jgi:hypothetical protein